MRIGILGGTFEPVHIGHLLLGEFAHEEFGLDEIWFLPNGNPPHKEARTTEAALKARMDMLKLATADVPYFRVNLSEADVRTHSYTYRTMEEFARRYPEDRFYFILGADSLFSIEEWKEYRRIFAACTILAAMRDDKDASAMERQISLLKSKYGADIRLLRAPLVEISSTAVRERAAQGKTVRYLVPDSVARYIRENKLYAG